MTETDLTRLQLQVLQRIVRVCDEKARPINMAEVGSATRDFEFSEVLRTVQELQARRFITTNIIAPNPEGRTVAGMPRVWDRTRPTLPKRVEFALTWLRQDVAFRRAQGETVPIPLEELAEWWSEVCRP